MILWTLQSPLFWESLQRRGRVRAKWRQVDRPWKPAYLWIAHEMVRRGIAARLVAPLWAWHSCGALGRAPDQETIEALKGWTGEEGLKIEIDAPAHLVLLSDYSAWNQIIDEAMDANEHGTRLDPLGHDWQRALRVDLRPRPPWKDDPGDIQACLPYIDLAWVRGLEGYKLPSC